MAVFDLGSSLKKTIKLRLPIVTGLVPPLDCFFRPADAIIKAAEAESIQPSSSAVKPFIKTSSASAPSWRMHAQ